MAGGRGQVADSKSPLDRVPPELLVLSGTISAQVGGGIATTLIREHGPLPVVAMRIVFGAAILLVFARIRVRGISRPAFLSCLALGLVLASMNSFFYLAISRIPLGVAVTIEFCGPLAVAVLGSRRWLDLVWAALAAAGIYVLAGARVEAGDLVGVAAAFASGICWATYIVVGSRVAREWPDGRGLTLAMVIAAATIVPVALVGSDVRVVLNGAALAGGVVIALFSSALPYGAEIAALRRLRPATFGVLMSLEPAIAAIVGFVLLGQLLGLDDAVAIGCVALASAGASLTARRLAVTPGELEAA